MSRPITFARRHFGGGDSERPEAASRGLASLLRVDLHAMVRLLYSQPLTVADILSCGPSEYREPSAR